MREILKYETFDGKLHDSFTDAMRYLNKLESGILNKIGLDLARCDIDKIDNLTDKDREFLSRSERVGGAFKIHERNYMQYYINNNLHLFEKLIAIRDDRNLEE